MDQKYQNQIRLLIWRAYRELSAAYFATEYRPKGTTFSEKMQEHLDGLPEPGQEDDKPLTAAEYRELEQVAYSKELEPIRTALSEILDPAYEFHVDDTIESIGAFTEQMEALVSVWIFPPLWNDFVKHCNDQYFLAVMKALYISGKAVTYLQGYGRLRSDNPTNAGRTPSKKKIGYQAVYDAFYLIEPGLKTMHAISKAVRRKLIEQEWEKRQKRVDMADTKEKRRIERQVNNEIENFVYSREYIAKLLIKDATLRELLPKKKA